MKRKHVGSLGYQIQRALFSKTAFGESKREAKAQRQSFHKIYSYQTYHTYLKACNRFANFCKNNYNAKTIEDCKLHVNDFIQDRRDNGISAYTQKMELCAIGKLYGHSFFDSVQTDARHRENITRSRNISPNNLKSGERHAQIRRFIERTGLRKHELRSVTPEDLIKKGKDYFIFVKNGKNGKSRLAPVLHGDKKVVDLMKSTPKGEQVFKKLPNDLSYHYYRRCYAQDFYNSKNVDISKLAKKDIYYCRGDKKSIAYSKPVLQELSSALGHTRISVCALHYLS